MKLQSLHFLGSSKTMPQFQLPPKKGEKSKEESLSWGVCHSECHCTKINETSSQDQGEFTLNTKLPK